jgi:hypothetical protein
MTIWLSSLGFVITLRNFSSGFFLSGPRCGGGSTYSMILYLRVLNSAFFYFFCPAD